MNIQDLIVNLKQDVENKLLTQDFDGAVKTLERQKQKIRELIGVVMPNYVFEQNRIKFNNEAIGYSYSFHTKAEERRKEYMREKYAQEQKILDTEIEEDYEKQQILFKKSKEKLEQRYHTQFKSAQDFITMNNIYETYADIEQSLTLLEETKRTKNAFEALENEDKKNWEEIANLWKSLYAKTIIDSTETIFKSLTALKKSSKFEINSDDTTDLGEIFQDLDTNILEKLNLNSQVNYNNIYGLTKLIRKLNEGTLTFGEAICIDQRIYPSEASKIGLTFFSGHIVEKQDLTQDLIKKIRQKIVDTYHYNKNDPEFQIWMKKEKNTILDRWKKTAPDYSNIIHEYTPHILDKHLIVRTYSLKTIEPISKKDKLVLDGRLPKLLETLIEDGIINEAEIDPPLQRSYPNADYQKKTLEERISNGEALDLVIGPVIKSKRKLPLLESFFALEHNKSNIEKTPNSNKITSILKSSKNLDKIIHSDREYEIVYLGENMGFIASVNYFPRGNRHLEEIFRITLAQEDVEYEHTFEINGKRFEVKPLRSYMTKHKTDIEVMDSNNDIVEGANYLVVTNTSFKEFDTKYKKDFIANTQIFSCMLDGDNVFHILRDLNNIVKDFNFEKYSKRLGDNHQIEVKVHNFGGKFAFSLRSDCREFQAGNYEVVVMKNLTEYLSELGIEYAIKVEGSELSREVAKQKIQDREFAKDNLENIIKELQTGGYSRVIGHAIRNNEKYILKDVGPSKDKCMHCNQNFMHGSIKIRNDSISEKLPKTSLEVMHLLTFHPSLYPLTNDLEIISKLLKDSTNYEPTFIQTPQIISEMIEFAKICNKHSRYESKSQEFWFSTQGGIENQYEKEEIDSNPRLKYLLSKEKKLEAICKKYLELENTSAQKIQEKYEALGGKPLSEKTSPSNFWANELLIYSAYQLGNRQLLLTNNTNSNPNNNEVHFPEIPINFQITTYDGNF